MHPAEASCPPPEPLVPTGPSRSVLNSSQFRQNFSDCGAQATYGEIGWNHLFRHTGAYTVDQMTKGMVTDDQATSRVFCNHTQGLEYMVCTQNDGRLMGYMAGPVHADVWTWWVAVHHNIGIGPHAHVTTRTRKLDTAARQVSR